MKKSPFSKHSIHQPAITTKNIDNDIDSRLQTSTPEPLPPKKPKGRRILKWIIAIIAIIILALGTFVVVRGAGLLDKIFIGQNKSVFERIGDIISSQTGGSKLEGENNGQINILLLGIGGPGHDGPYLSDTIILAQLRPEDKKVTLISIPRDYLVNTKEIGQRKINAVFAESYQKDKDWNKAGASIREVVSNISGLEIPYFAVMDFKGFEKTIDMLGGVDIQIDRTFTDYTYPDNKNGYLPAVTFKEGHEQMDGERALIFARSRHAAGEEGTDYARSVRQQKIISAAKAKIISLNIIADAGKVNELFTIIGEHFHTNLSPGQLLHVYGLTKDFNDNQTISLSLDPDTGLICPQTLEESGAFVLTVCPGKTKTDIQDYFKNSFATGQLTSEQATVWLADSSATGKLYKKAETELTNAGITVHKVIYGGKPLTQNVIYSVNHKPSTSEYITSKLDASPVTLPPPGIKIDSSKVDIIIILGSPDTDNITNTSTNS